MHRGGTSLKDVAAHAGVSVKTVSNVVRGYVHVAPSTRERVQAAIDELGYRPNLSARNLRHGRTGMVALAVPVLDAPYFARLARRTIEAAAARGVTVLVEQTGGSRDRELEVLDGIGSPLIDGVMMSPLSLGVEDLAGRRGTAPLVLLGERVVDGPADHVAIDNVAAARDATAHLLASGRRRIAAVGAQDRPEAATSHLRLAGYRDALDAAGVPVDDALVVPVADYGRADGAAAGERLLALEEPPDAVFCFADTLALGVMRAVLAAGLRVPQDVAVVGVDDLEEAAFSVPSLSSVRPDLDLLAHTAVDMLLDRLEGDDRPPREMTVGHTLVVRESSAP